jgi:hypothetical protein
MMRNKANVIEVIFDVQYSQLEKYKMETSPQKKLSGKPPQNPSIGIT